MEPRIATLLGDSASVDPAAPPPPTSVAPRRPLPVEPAPAGDDARTNPAVLRSEYVAENDIGNVRSRPTPQRQKSSVPLAEVLNDEAPPSTPVIHNAPAQPFSGRLQDILLDPSQERSSKRRKLGGRTTPPALTGGENNLLTLPKLPQLPKKTTRRPRIPPLLQGLHQPPPLPPEGRLFPPITGDRGDFGKEIGDRVVLRSPADLKKGKEKDVEIAKEVDSSPISKASRTEKEAPIEKPTSPPLCSSTHDKENQVQVRDNAADFTKIKGKHTKKRNKWSDQETKDLLQGVAMFGIGSWKKILNHPEFHFTQRTAVDLKDRFRTCCPKDASKSRQSKGNDAGEESTLPDSGTSSKAPGDQAETQSDPPGNSKKPRKARSDQHKKTPAELAEMGIQAPFEPSKRRQRNEFSKDDDKNLWKGFEKYGPVWHLIRDDFDLGFGQRHPTDLRDRFRIRYPEEYAKAGYKLKPKGEQLLKEKQANNQDSPTSDSAKQPADEREMMEKPRKTSEPKPTTVTAQSSVSTLKAHTLLQPLRDSFPTPIEDFVDIMSEEDGEGGNSPITLSRHIFQWADANPAQSSGQAASTTIPAIASLTGDLGFNLFTSMDGMHIDPQALKFPLASIQNGTLASMPAISANPQAFGFSLAPSQTPNNMPTSHPVSTSAVPGSNAANASSSKQSMDALLRTPNLPTIVFPHVPVASARNAMHNLPPPADLLSGLDHENRTDGHPAGFVLDDSMAFVSLPSNSTTTLAPLVGSSNAGRGLMMIDREKGLFGDDPFGERSLLNSSI